MSVAPESFPNRVGILKLNAEARSSNADSDITHLTLQTPRRRRVPLTRHCPLGAMWKRSLHVRDVAVATLPRISANADSDAKYGLRPPFGAGFWFLDSWESSSPSSVIRILTSCCCHSACGVPVLTRVSRVYTPYIITTLSHPSLAHSIQAFSYLYTVHPRRDVGCFVRSQLSRLQRTLVDLEHDLLLECIHSILLANACQARGSLSV
ncbi:uncharacterized protein EI90DRAFT_852123 [Cantharellus anzutake]|uniref:uncharacterized protein n=1 Tax=Cantharellus anzutake TaxID=1750568 RepID=UPI00190722F1|nr:uncharacterized protein EI90DRAFT_852123 [Cantharellus anzutake]KAF8332365.1 hypothetical protein EI90DRAFT_852123 [Cantharellus anzutake]